MPGQQAFGTIQEIVGILEADPVTNWSKVNISALREHLIDMDEVTMRAKASERALSEGAEIIITGHPDLHRHWDCIERQMLHRERFERISSRRMPMPPSACAVRPQAGHLAT